jgi:outer membrane lipoprotein SlyB
MRWFSVLAVLTCLAVTGCAQNDSRSDDNRYGGFYGGMSGGMAR